jgi:hypothetical protein
LFRDELEGLKVPFAKRWVTERLTWSWIIRESMVAARALKVGEFRPSRGAVGFGVQASFEELQFGVGCGELAGEPSLSGEVGRGGISPVFWVGLEVGLEIEVEGWVTGCDDIVVHIAVGPTDVA